MQFSNMATASRTRPHCLATRRSPLLHHLARSYSHSQQVALTGLDYDTIVDQLASRALHLETQAKQQQQHKGPLIIGIAGAPGSGKSTLAALAAQRINELALQEEGPSAHPVAVVVPMDGFHLYRRQLDAMPDPQVRACLLGCIQPQMV